MHNHQRTFLSHVSLSGLLAGSVFLGTHPATAGEVSASVVNQSVPQATTEPVVAQSRSVDVTGPTSQCSFLDLEPVCQHEVYAGQRVKRCLFRAADGRTIHADVNASYNILRKVIPDAFAKGTGAAVVQPVRVYPRPNVKAMV